MNYKSIAIMGVAALSLGFGAGYFTGKRITKQEAAVASDSKEVQEARQHLQNLRLQFTEESRFVKDAKAKLAMLEQRHNSN